MGLMIWGLGQLPQLIKFYTTELITGVSFRFLVLRLVGDVLYLVNGIMINLPLNNRSIISYFCFIDTVLVLQYWYYYDKSRMSSLPNRWLGVLAVASSTNGLYIQQNLLKDSSDNFHYSPILIIWLSITLFILSRVFQIAKNYRLKVMNLSLKFVVLYYIGTVCYLINLILELFLLIITCDDTKDPLDFVYDYLPYLLGAIGTIIGDSIILYQYHIYKYQEPTISHAYHFTPTWPAYDEENDLVHENNTTNRQTNSLAANSRLQHTSEVTNSLFKPSESQYLLKNSLYNIPAHYVSSYDSIKPKHNNSNIISGNTVNSQKSGFLSLFKSAGNSFKSGSFSVSRNSHLSTSLLPSMIGNYSKVSRKMSQDTKVPFSPIDFLSDHLEDDISE